MFPQVKLVFATLNYLNTNEDILPMTTANVIKFDAVLVMPETGRKQNTSNLFHSNVIRNTVLAKQESIRSEQDRKSKQERA